MRLGRPEGDETVQGVIVCHQHHLMTDIFTELVSSPLSTCIHHGDSLPCFNIDGLDRTVVSAREWSNCVAFGGSITCPNLSMINDDDAIWTGSLAGVRADAGKAGSKMLYECVGLRIDDIDRRVRAVGEH